MRLDSISNLGFIYFSETQHKNLKTKLYPNYNKVCKSIKVTMYKGIFLLYI